MKPSQPPRITKMFVSYKEIPTCWLPLAQAGGPSVCLSAAPRTVKWMGVVILHEVNLEDIPQDCSFSSQTPPSALCNSNLLKKLLILSNRYNFLASGVPQVSSLPSVGAVQSSGPCLPLPASRTCLPPEPASAQHCTLSVAFSDNWKKRL